MYNGKYIEFDDIMAFYLDGYNFEKTIYDNVLDFYFDISEGCFQKVNIVNNEELFNENMNQIDISEDEQIITFEDESGNKVQFSDDIQVTGYLMSNPETEAYIEIYYLITVNNENTLIKCSAGLS